MQLTVRKQLSSHFLLRDSLSGSFSACLVLMPRCGTSCSSADLAWTLLQVTRMDTPSQLFLRWYRYSHHSHQSSTGQCLRLCVLPCSRCAVETVPTAGCWCHLSGVSASSADAGLWSQIHSHFAQQLPSHPYRSGKGHWVRRSTERYHRIEGEEQTSLGRWGSGLGQTSLLAGRSLHTARPPYTQPMSLCSSPSPSPTYPLLNFASSHWYSLQTSQIPMLLFPLSCHRILECLGPKESLKII